MGNKISIKCKAMKFKNGCLLLPATRKDSIMLDTFCEDLGQRYATVVASYSKSQKTYDQCKTVFALTAIIFECNYNRKPSSTENEQMYRELLEEFGEREPCLYNPDKTIPIPLSRQSKWQAAQFINNLINIIVENCDLTDAQQVTVKELFEEFKKENSTGELNPCDYGPDGHEYSIDEWCEVNNISMASGVNDGTLEIAHIITKSKRPDIRNCTWNFLRLTHYEHLEIQHRKGWQELLAMFPHLLPRVKRAYDMAGELYPFTVKNDFDNFEKEESTEDLADQALNIF